MKIWKIVSANVLILLIIKQIRYIFIASTKDLNVPQIKTGI